MSRPAVIASILSIALFVALIVGEPAQADGLSPAGELPADLTHREPLIRSARDLLRLYGMDDARLVRFDDSAPLVDEQHELLLRMLFAIRRFSLADQRRYAQHLSAVELLKSFKEQRGELIQLRGKLLDVQAEHPEGRLAERFEMPVVYRCEVLLDDTQPAVIYALHVPQAWRQRSEDEANPPGRDERISALGFAARLVSGAGEPRPVLVAQRLAWHPHTPFGEIDGDAGLFETVKNNSAMQSNDSPCFYDMLAACGRVGTNQLLRLAPAESSVARLFPPPNKKNIKTVLEPLTARGELVSFVGTAQRAVLVRIEDSETIAAYGFDHYYEIELWHANAQGNPLVFCMRKLPEGMPVGERIGIDVTMAGFFFKTWTYKINKVIAGEEKSRYQIAPLMIGREPILVPREAPDPWLGLLGGGIFALAVVGAWVGVAWSQRQNRRFRERVIGRIHDPNPQPVSFDLERFDHGAEHFHDYPTSAPLLESEEPPQTPS